MPAGRPHYARLAWAGVWIHTIHAMDKNQVADILLEIGTLLELKGENPFKTRAYSSAARALDGLSEPLETLVAENRLGGIKGIGASLEKKIAELVTTGKLAYYDELKASLPLGLTAMLDIPGLGPKKVKALYDHLEIDSIEKLEAACLASKVAALDGFGEKSQAKILEGIQFHRSYASKHLLMEAAMAAEPVLEALRGHPDVIRCAIAGSLRRNKEMIGDVDFLVSSTKPAAVIEFFTSLPGIISISARGETKASVVLDKGLQADLRVVSDAEYPFALAYFTGSKEHNIVMRQRAIQRGLRLNEYGLFESQQETRDPKLLKACQTEEEIYEKLGLAYVPPELREDKGEFEAAERDEIPRLIEWTQLRGSLHNHSSWSDGRVVLDDIVAHMREHGFSYWAITDHSRAAVQANGLSPEKLREQIQVIHNINARLRDEGETFELLCGAEVDILSDGRLDFDDDLLAQLDVVVASIHGGFTQNEAEMTKRLIRAAQNPFVHMLGHLTGRLLLEREPYAVNQHAVIDACGESGTWIELNAHPRRYDMDWRLWPYAKSKGVLCAINCDAHRNEHAQFLRLGVGVARKGWLTSADVVNTRPLPELRKALRKKRER
jgi:DNA polymerase (family X)